MVSRSISVCGERGEGGGEKHGGVMVETEEEVTMGVRRRGGVSAGVMENTKEMEVTMGVECKGGEAGCFSRRDIW